MGQILCCRVFDHRLQDTPEVEVILVEEAAAMAAEVVVVDTVSLKIVSQYLVFTKLILLGGGSELY